jgi:predicted dehydrogenase
MEAFMYRCHEQIRRVLELIRANAIGQVRLIRANFAFNAKFNPEARLFNNALGGGGILDVGCYCTSMARLIAGAALDKDVAEPLAVTGYGHLGQTGVDEWAIASASSPAISSPNWPPAYT